MDRKVDSTWRDMWRSVNFVWLGAGTEAGQWGASEARMFPVGLVEATELSKLEGQEGRQQRAIPGPLSPRTDVRDKGQSFGPRLLGPALPHRVTLSPLPHACVLAGLELPLGIETQEEKQNQGASLILLLHPLCATPGHTAQIPKVLPLLPPHKPSPSLHCAVPSA